MAYNKFTLQIIFRIILIVANCFFLVTEFEYRDYIITVINLSVLLIIQTIFLIQYIRKTNLKIVAYFDLLKNNESGFRMKNTEAKNSFSQIRKQFDDTNKIIQDIKIDKEVQSNYLQHIVNYINIGLFSYDENEKIGFINPEAKRILGITNIFKIEDLKVVNKDFADFLRKLKPGQSEVIEISDPAIKQKLSVNCGLLSLKDVKIKLVSFQDIKTELEEQEILAWQKLIRVLTHEINNSVIPISNLTELTMSEERERFVKQGFNEYISKPVREEKLIELLGKHLVILTD